jgi:hypothetical protein
MHLRNGIEEIYKEQTATKEVKTKINGRIIFINLYLLDMKEDYPTIQ